MSPQPELKPGDLIEITGSYPVPAVVASIAFEDTYEVVYIDETGNAVVEEVQWADGVWRFLHLTPKRLRAGNQERYQSFVRLLQEKRSK